MHCPPLVPADRQHPLKVYAWTPDTVAVLVHEPDVLESVYMNICIAVDGHNGARREEPHGRCIPKFGWWAWREEMEEKDLK